MTKSFTLPVGACDCHIHVLNSKEQRGSTQGQASGASWHAYEAEARPLGLERAVLIQPSFYGLDNGILLATLRSSRGRARGVAVITEEIADDTLDEYHRDGIRGVRFNTISGGLDLSRLEDVAKRIRPYGWHIQVYIDSANLPEIMPRLLNLGVDCVLDHMAHVDPASSTCDPGFGALLGGMDTGRIWVKLSNALFQPDINRARLLVNHNPERVVWASDWPHVIFRGQPKPLAALLRAVPEYCDHADTIIRLLVDNPTRLYFF